MTFKILANLKLVCYKVYTFIIMSNIRKEMQHTYFVLDILDGQTSILANVISIPKPHKLYRLM
jgi:hypothetical protein